LHLRAARDTGGDTKRCRPAPARKARYITEAPLNAAREATRKQDLQVKADVARLQKRPASIAHSHSLDVFGLITRRTKALIELPSRFARCHSPFALWGEQARFVGESFADYTRHLTIFVGGFRQSTQQSLRHG